MAKLVIRHDLHAMSAEELKNYLRDVSEFLGLDPDLNALDAIWMPNESGTGQTLVVYARRGTAEILRNKLGIEVDSLVSEFIDGSVMFTAKGHDAKGRHEIAIGSKHVKNLEGKLRDDAIMTASTRALRRLTMQFTTLGILDESEVSAAKGEAPPTNPAANVAPAPNPLPPVFSVPSVPANNAPGKPVEPVPAPKPAPEPPVAAGEQFLGQPEKVQEAMAQHPAKTEDTKTVETPVTPVESTVTPEPEADKKAAKPRRGRKPKNTVALDVEPETVSVPTQANFAAPPQATPASAPVAAAPPPISVPAVGPDPVQAAAPAELPVAPASVAGMPSKEQMDSYRKKVGVFTAQLPASADMGSVQKMRAFITKMSTAAPQDMTVVQWEQQIAWFDEFSARNSIKGLIKYINDCLGVK